MTTGEKIRYFRTSHELTQEQLASQSGLSISALQNMNPMKGNQSLSNY